MTYFEQTASKDEKILFEGKISFWNFLGLISLAILLVTSSVMDNPSSYLITSEVPTFIQVFFIAPVAILRAVLVDRWSSIAPENAFLISLLPAAIAALLLVYACLLVKTTELVISSKRVFAKIGIISTQTIEIDLNKIEGVTVSQGIIGTILGYGTVSVSGTGTSKTPISGIRRPKIFRKKLREAQEASTNQQEKQCP